MLLKDTIKNHVKTNLYLSVIVTKYLYLCLIIIQALPCHMDQATGNNNPHDLLSNLFPQWHPVRASGSPLVGSTGGELKVLWGLSFFFQET